MSRMRCVSANRSDWSAKNGRLARESITISTRLAIPLHAAYQSDESPLLAPPLYLSNRDAGWEGFVVEEFHEPIRMESIVQRNRSDISLTLFTGETLHVEWR